MRLEHKTFLIVANSDAGTRCHVHLLDLYISKLPKEAIETDIFYCRPVQCVPVVILRSHGIQQSQ